LLVGGCTRYVAHHRPHTTDHTPPTTRHTPPTTRHTPHATRHTPPKVEAPEGVTLYTHSSFEAKVISTRQCGEYVRVVSMDGNWLKLHEQEKYSKGGNLAIGTKVTIIGGDYTGERGEVVRAIDEMRELGVKLVGYSGTSCSAPLIYSNFVSMN
jgi:hypothetical protein